MSQKAAICATWVVGVDQIALCIGICYLSSMPQLQRAVYTRFPHETVVPNLSISV